MRNFLKCFCLSALGANFSLVLLGLTLAGCAQPAPIVVTKDIYLPWAFPPELVAVPTDPPVTPWLNQSDAAHYIIALKGVADNCRLIHAAAVAAAATPPPDK